VKDAKFLNFEVKDFQFILLCNFIDFHL